MLDPITLTSAILGLVGAFVATPWGQAMAARYARKVKQTRALARLQAEPHYKVGAEIEVAVADTNGGAAECFRNHRIAYMGLGRVVLESLDDHRLVTPMTCAEFEQLTVTMRDHTANC